ncbi:MAG: FeoB-associated Cys-rich membrane protein [Clostridiales bacterium]|nr:FeoB-associated Cys-rich membrane protein [Clostridiales bacterium]MDD7492104.1 FeoB-associated Cys-rich membrane protein [Clostridiales bacterium]
MFAWLAENLGTIAISAVLLAIVAAIVIYLIRQKKQGKSTCGAGCAHCANADCCHHHE